MQADQDTGAPEPNYDETKVSAFDLPDPLRHDDGAPVSTAEEWWERRRPQIVGHFERQVFGASPGAPSIETRIVSEDRDALGGAAIRQEISVTFGTDAPELRLLVYFPAGSDRRWPAMLGPNFLGNHTIHADPGIRLPDIAFSPAMDVRLPDERPTEASRGFHSERWPVELILARGYAVATFYYGDLFPDHAGGRPQSIQPHFGKTHYSWGAIATWSWAMSRALDALASNPRIDAGRVALVGHSRHGKAALWAGALDRRFALIVANNSGKGGASLARRNFGETIAHLTSRYPHWFTASYADFFGREWALPVDAHMLISLTAPRPVYIASAQADLWADPRGEFLAALAADPVYRLLGRDGLGAREMPDPERPVMSAVGYHVRRGGHGITRYDWEQFLTFADRQMLR